MEFLRTWAISVCICSFAVLIIRIIVPKGNMEKSMNIILSLFIISSFVLPISTDKIKSEFNFDEIQIDNSRITENSKSMLKSELRMLTNKALNNIGIDDFELEIDLNIDENGKVNLTKYELKIPKNSDIQEIKQGIEKEVGISPKISEMS